MDLGKTACIGWNYNIITIIRWVSRYSYLNHYMGGSIDSHCIWMMWVNGDFFDLSWRLILWIRLKWWESILRLYTINNVGQIFIRDLWNLRLVIRSFLGYQQLEYFFSFDRWGRLGPRIIGSFEVVERVVEVAYKLLLSSSLKDVHDTFQVSQLRCYISNTSHIFIIQS